MTDFLYRLFIEPVCEVFFQKALIGGCVAAVVCSVVGCLVILRRMAFLGDALSHAMIAGVAAGYLFMKLVFSVEAHAPSMLVGSLVAAVLTVASIGFVSRISRLKEDTVIGIMYTGVFAAGVVLVSTFQNYIHIDLMHFIMGDVLGVADSDLWIAAFVAALVLSVIVLFFRYFHLTSFDPIMAASLGLPVLLIDYVLTTCVSLVVVSAVSMVGVILVVGLLITPAASAYLLCDRLDRMMLWAAVFGTTSVVGGLYLSVWVNSSGGGAIMLCCTFQFLVVLTFAPQYGLLAGWLRRRRLIPQQLLEDVLVTILRAQGRSLSPTDLAGFVTPGATRLSTALRSMKRNGLLTQQDGGYVLTPQGQAEANRILRAHRIWEAYLKHVGVAVTDIHTQAHHLEHIHDAASVEYLDDLLGHPTHDPHGSTIPENYTHCLPGSVCPLSVLREGRVGTIVRINDEYQDVPLHVGESVRTGPRLENGTRWSIVRSDGTELMLDHWAADRIMVKVEN